MEKLAQPIEFVYAELIAQRSALDAQIKAMGADMRKIGNDAMPKAEYDYFVEPASRPSGGHLHIYRQMKESSVKAFADWKERYAEFGVSLPFHLREPGSKEGMTWWLVYNESGEPMLITTGGGTVILRDNPDGDGWYRSPVKITIAERDALLAGTVPKTLIKG